MSFRGTVYDGQTNSVLFDLSNRSEQKMEINPNKRKSYRINGNRSEQKMEIYGNHHITYYLIYYHGMWGIGGEVEVAEP